MVRLERGGRQRQDSAVSRPSVVMARRATGVVKCVCAYPCIFVADEAEGK